MVEKVEIGKSFVQISVFGPWEMFGKPPFEDLSADPDVEVVILLKSVKGKLDDAA